MGFKFAFTTEFQYEILRFIVIDKHGYQALELLNESYFTLVEHSYICSILKRYYKKKRKVPGLITLIEDCNEGFSRNKIDLTKEEQVDIINLVRGMYHGIIKDGDTLLEKIEDFVKYVDLRDVVEGTDLQNVTEYNSLVSKVQKAVSPRLRNLNEKGTFLIKDVKDRQFKRQDSSPIVATPFKQINSLTNAGGYARGGIIVLLDRPKKFKTGALANIGRAYMKRGKNILLVDLENGEDELSIRVEQSMAKKTKEQILSGKYDNLVQKILRKYKRLKSEMIIKRFPAYVTTTADIRTYIDYLYREFGIRIDILILDYAALLGSVTSKTDDDNKRISDIYIELSNLALEKDIEHIWTAMHVKREAEKRESTRYKDNDIAKCIDIVRHVQAIFGLNRNEEEEDNGFMRLELVVQRDGVKKGRAVFQVDYGIQRMEELTFSQRAEYDKAFSIFGEHKEGSPKDDIESDL